MGSDYYALKRHGRDYRIMVIGISRGYEGKKSHLYNFLAAEFDPGTPHIKGTIAAVKVLLEGIEGLSSD